MVKYFSIILFLLVSAVSMGQATSIKFTVKGAEGQSVILGYYFNKQLLIKDTIALDNSATALYKPANKLDEGMYVLYFPNQTYLDFVIGADQEFQVITSQTDMLANTTISGSVESQLFLDYQKLIAVRQQEFEALRQKLGDDGGAELQEAYTKINGEVTGMAQRLIDANPGSFLSLFLTGLKEVELPDYKKLQPSLSDSLARQKQYYYYRAHFFDNIALNDSRSLRTPYFTSKIDTYFSELLPQIPDTIAVEAVNFIEKTRSDKDMFKYVVSYLYNLTNESKIMGMDAALVAIADRYYLSGEAFWAESKFLDELRENVQKIKPTIIGNIAPDLKLGSFDNQYFRLHEVNSRFTLLVFWETDCGHCQKDIPQLHKIWEDKLKSDTKVFCVYTQTKTTEWQKFVEDNAMENWINVYDPRNSSNFRTVYNINTTPQIFILDSNKKIVAKKIGVDQVADIIDYLRTKKD